MASTAPSPPPQTQLTDHLSVAEIEKVSAALRACIQPVTQAVHPSQFALHMGTEQGRLALAHDLGRESVVRWFEDTLKNEKARTNVPV